MAYDAGAELMDMEFTQFHPTGMVWPPSVRGTLVTEGVRGEGGILVNSENKRFMYDNIPDRFAAETADTEEEADRWLAGDKDARRPPELLTRDVVARAIRKEVKAGRGSPHGGAFLDIANRRNAEDIKRKLPSMYHQFNVLAELDITKESMEVGPTLHYFMGGVKVDADTQMTKVPGLFACGECAAGVHGANRLGGNSLSDLLVCGKLAGSGAVNYIKSQKNKKTLNNDVVEKAIRTATDILNRENGENPYLIHEELQDLMQDNVGIVRTDELLSKGIDGLSSLWEKFKNVKADGACQFNPGWHQAISLRNLLVTAESVARAARMREESRGAHTRVDFEGESDEWLKYNVVISKSDDGKMIAEKTLREEPDPELKRIAELSIDELEKEVSLEGNTK
jgi:succinate dehydrogenase / fumarate reductase flavoprotein subunit